MRAPNASRDRAMDGVKAGIEKLKVGSKCTARLQEYRTGKQSFLYCSPIHCSLSLRCRATRNSSPSIHHKKRNLL